MNEKMKGVKAKELRNDGMELGVLEKLNEKLKI